MWIGARMMVSFVLDGWRLARPCCPSADERDGLAEIAPTKPPTVGCLAVARGADADTLRRPHGGPLGHVDIEVISVQSAFAEEWDVFGCGLAPSPFVLVNQAIGAVGAKDESQSKPLAS